MITVSIYCYPIKYQAKKIYLLPFHDTNNELKQKLLLPFHDTINELKEVIYCYIGYISQRYRYKKPHIHFLDGIINVKKFDPDNIKINEKSYW